jgi:hypothetical protein
VDRDAASADIDAEVRALALAGVPVFLRRRALRDARAEVVLTQSLCDVYLLP